MYSRKKAQGVLFFDLVEEYGERRGGRHVKGRRIRGRRGGRHIKERGASADGLSGLPKSKNEEF